MPRTTVFENIQAYQQCLITTVFKVSPWVCQLPRSALFHKKLSASERLLSSTRRESRCPKPMQKEWQECQCRQVPEPQSRRPLSCPEETVARISVLPNLEKSREAGVFPQTLGVCKSMGAIVWTLKLPFPLKACVFKAWFRSGAVERWGDL